MNERPYGLLQLAGSEDAVVDIVFVHGFTGDRESNWTSQNNTFWPKTLLPQSIPNARILTWGYHHGSIPDPDYITKRLCANLVATRIHNPDRPIIFVGHDFGAVICANIIDFTYPVPAGRDVRRIADCVRGFILMGIPRTGPNLIEWEDLRLWHSNLSPEVKHDIDISSLRFLLRSMDNLSKGRLRDVLRRERIDTFDFYEQDDGDFFGKLFTRDMAILPDNCLSIPGNHETMCKFDSSEEPGYIMITWLLQKWIKELPKQTSGGPADPAEPSIATDVPALDTPAELRILHELLGLSKEEAVSTSEDSKEQSKPLLSPETVRWLASKELLSSIQKKSLTISTAPLLESFEIPTKKTSSTQGNWSLSEDDKPFLRKIDVPISLYSAETYEFLGYQCSVAETLWNSFNAPENRSFSLFDVSKENLEVVSKEHLEVDPSAKSEYDWDNFMDKIGICDSLRNSILHSHLDNIRSTESYMNWLRIAFEIRWQELKELNKDLLKVIKRTSSTSERPTGSSVPSHDHGASTEQSQSSGHQDTAQQPAEQHSGEKEERGPAAATDSPNETNEPGNEKITLWRGSTKTKIENATENGRLHVNEMLSLPGDFSGRTKVPYFATRRNTAELYGAFHASLSQIGTPPYLLEFQVGKKWLLGLQHRCLWAGKHRNNPCELGKSECLRQRLTEDVENRSWEHVVFTCRREDWTPSVLTQQELAIGHIAAFHDEEVKKMNSEAEIKPGKLFVAGEPAVQYAFLSEVSQKGLEAEASGVKTKRLGGLILKICMDNCPGKPRVNHFRFIDDLCQDCKAKWSGDSKSGSKKRKRSASP